MDILRALLDPWTWRMAWRDSRRSRGRLALFSLSISLGIAALVALGSLGDSLRDSLRDQSKSLLGADLVLASSVPPSAAATEYLGGLGLERAGLTRFSMMVSARGRDSVGLAYVNAITGGFPFYGRIDAEPPASVEAFRQGRGVLVSDSLARQMSLHVGDSVTIGHWTAPVVGMVRWMPGDSMSVESLAPRICMAGSRMPEVLNPVRRSMILRVATNVVEKATNVRYLTLVRLAAEVSVEKFLEQQAGSINRFGLDVDTIALRRHYMGRTFGDVTTYLNLSSLVALLLGTVGISTAIQAHVQQRVAQVAVLRCLGAPLASTFAIYFVQALAMGFLGSSVGIGLGVATLRSLQAIFGQLVLVEVQVRLSGPVVAQSLAAGVGLSLAFALLPLLGLRRISPLSAIRAAHEPPRRGIDLARTGLCIAIGLLVLGFAVVQSDAWTQGVHFVVGLGITFLVLSAVAVGLVRGVGGLSRPSLPFAWRQGVASLHRPHNRTHALLVSLGLVTFLVVVMQVTRSSLLSRLARFGHSGEPNLLVFDVRSDQVAGLTRMMERHRIPPPASIPWISLRVVSVNDAPLRIPMPTVPGPSSSATNAAPGPPRWLRKVHHATILSRWNEADPLEAGRWVGPVSPSTHPVPLVIDREVAMALGVGPGDRLGLEVHGTAVDCEVVAVRATPRKSVDPLRRMLNPALADATVGLRAGGGTNLGANFRFLFPEGALDPALVRYLMATRSEDASATMAFQTELARSYPGASAIDVSRLNETFASFVGKSVFAIRFVGLFTVCTGVYVLAGTILIGRWQRAREGLLLRTLGASRNQVRRVLLVEYLLLGGLSAATGGVLAVAAGWALVHFVFGAEFHVLPLELSGTLLALPLLTILVGVLTGRGVANAPPLEVLREEN